MNMNRWLMVFAIILTFHVLTILRLVTGTTELRAEMGKVMRHVEPPGSVRTADVGVDTTRPYLGDLDAPIRLVIFPDFECPAYALLADQIPTLVIKFPDSLCISYWHFSISSHSQSRTLSELAKSGDRQGVSWAFHDSLFTEQGELDNDRPIGLCNSLQLPVRTDDSSQQIVAENIALAKKLDVKSAPTLFINGRRVIGA